MNAPSTFFVLSSPREPIAVYLDPEAAGMALEQTWLYNQRNKNKDPEFPIVDAAAVTVEEYPLVYIDGKISWVDSVPTSVDDSFVDIMGPDYYTDQGLRDYVENLFHAVIDGNGGIQMATVDMVYQMTIHGYLDGDGLYDDDDEYNDGWYDPDDDEY